MANNSVACGWRRRSRNVSNISWHARRRRRGGSRSCGQYLDKLH
uniref:Uncharacterized protein n=1 Tax=Anopheles arabiensis TaxID=7173 RepID=A0A182IFZ9_ANOAR